MMSEEEERPRLVIGSTGVNGLILCQIVAAEGNSCGHLTETYILNHLLKVAEHSF